MGITFLFKAHNGGMDLGSDANRARFKDALQHYHGKDFRIEMIERKRSFSQNNFYWFYLEEIERETGQPTNDCHELFKRKFLNPRFVKVFREELKLTRSTTELTKHEFSEYLDKIAAFTEVAIPDVALWKKLNGINEGRIEQSEINSFHQGLEIPKGDVTF